MWEDGQEASGAEKPVPGAPPDAGKSGEDKGEAKTKDKDTVSLSKKEYDSLLKRTTELEESERYWAGEAKASAVAKVRLVKSSDKVPPSTEADSDRVSMS